MPTSTRNHGDGVHGTARCFLGILVLPVPWLELYGEFLCYLSRVRCGNGKAVPCHSRVQYGAGSRFFHGFNTVCFHVPWFYRGKAPVEIFQGILVSTTARRILPPKTIMPPEDILRSLRNEAVVQFPHRCGRPNTHLYCL